MKDILNATLLFSGLAYILIVRTPLAMVVFGFSVLVFLAYPLTRDYATLYLHDITTLDR